MNRLLSALLAGAMALSVACDSRSPREDYDDFRDRTASFRDDVCAADGARTGVYADISGRWLINALLKGGISLGLRVDFEKIDGEGDAPPVVFDARIWLWDQPDDAAPLVETQAVVGEDGRFELVADPLDLGTEVIESEAAVIAIVTMNSLIIDPQTWCGDATGSVTSPLQLVLDGSTFFAAPNPDGTLTPQELPFECPGDPCAPDSGVEEDAGVADGGVPDGGPMRPESPDLSGIASTRGDITGEYFMLASLNGIPLRLWLSLIYREGVDADGQIVASIDGSLRTVTQELDSPPASTFAAEVDADGRFEIWLPEFELDVGGLVVQGDILLAAATVDGGFCGEAAGEVRSPFEIDLAGSTFFASPWVPGGEQPMDVPNACPPAE